MSTTLAELEAAGAKAAAIRAALESLKAADQKLALVNRYAAQHAGKHWSPELSLGKGDHWTRDVILKVKNIGMMIILGCRNTGIITDIKNY